MSNPYLPKWEYIPDGEPRVFGNRIYVYGSHDRAGSSSFCDYILKVWSASLDDLSHWVCHGDAFCTRTSINREKDVDWSDKELYAPDVVEYKGKYYLYAYIVDSEGCIAVSDRPEGPFKLLSKYKFNKTAYPEQALISNGIFIDPGVLVDNDRIYLFCGYLKSFAVELENDMVTVKDETYIEDIIPDLPDETGFFEACSPRKIGNKYYLIYSPKIGSRLAYAVSDKPLGPYHYGGILVDNGIDYPGGNNHGSICEINGQWYVFYHRMTNGTVYSRRGCVERICFDKDGNIGQVEMTSLGFDKMLSPYEEVKAEIACVVKGRARVKEENIFDRIVTDIKKGCIIGFKYLDFGNDMSSKTITLNLKVKNVSNRCSVRIVLDDYVGGEEIGTLKLAPGNGIFSDDVKSVSGVHSIFFIPEAENEENLFDFICWMFSK